MTIEPLVSLSFLVVDRKNTLQHIYIYIVFYSKILPGSVPIYTSESPEAVKTSSQILYGSVAS